MASNDFTFKISTDLTNLFEMSKNIEENLAFFNSFPKTNNAILQIEEAMASLLKVSEDVVEKFGSLDKVAENVKASFSDINGLNKFIQKMNEAQTALDDFQTVANKQNKKFVFDTKYDFMPVDALKNYINPKNMEGVDQNKLQKLIFNIKENGFNEAVSIAFNDSKKGNRRAEVLDSNHILSILAAEQLQIPYVPIQANKTDQEDLFYKYKSAPKYNSSADYRGDLNPRRIFAYDKITDFSDIMEKFDDEFYNIYEKVIKQAKKLDLVQTETMDAFPTFNNKIEEKEIKEPSVSSKAKEDSDVVPRSAILTGSSYNNTEKELIHTLGSNLLNEKDELEADINAIPKANGNAESVVVRTAEEYLKQGLQNQLGYGFEEYQTRQNYLSQKKGQQLPFPDSGIYDPKQAEVLAKQKELEAEIEKSEQLEKQRQEFIQKAINEIQNQIGLLKNRKDLIDRQQTIQNQLNQNNPQNIKTPTVTPKETTQPSLQDKYSNPNNIQELADYIKAVKQSRGMDKFSDKEYMDRASKLIDTKNWDLVKKYEDYGKELIRQKILTGSIPKYNDLKTPIVDTDVKISNPLTEFSQKLTDMINNIKSAKQEVSSSNENVKPQEQIVSGGPVTVTGAPVTVTGSPVTVTGKIELSKEQSTENVTAPEIKTDIKVSNLTNTNSQLVQFIENLKEIGVSINSLATAKSVITSIVTELISLSRANSELRDLKSAVSDVSNMIQLLKSSIDSLNKSNVSFDKLTKNVENITSIVSTLNTTMNGVDSSNVLKLSEYFQMLSTSLNEVKSQTNAINELVLDLNGANKILGLLANNITRVNNVVDSMGKGFKSTKFTNYFSSYKDTITEIGNSMKKISPQFSNKFENLNSSINSINSIVNSITKLQEKTENVDSMNNLNAFFERLTQVCNSLSVSMKELEPSMATIQQLTESLKNLSVAFNEADKNQKEFVSGLNSKKIVEGQKQINQNVKETTNSTKHLLNVFEMKGNGILSFLQNAQSKLTNFRYTFEALAVFFGGRQIYNWLIGTNAQIEVLQKSLEVTLHSAEEADEAIRKLRDYAALTPFQELETFKSGEMLAANRMDIQRWVQVAGDLASAKQTAGVQLEDVVNVLTRINAGDFGKAMIRLRQMGISLNDLRNEGLKFSKSNTFLGSTEEMLNALERIINKRYGGLTQVLGKTVQGSISTIKDYVLQLGIEMGDGLFGNFKESLNDVKQELGEFRNSTKFKEIVRDFNSFIDQMKEPFMALVNVIKLLGSLIADNLGTLGFGLRMLIDLKLLQTGVSLFVTLRNNVKMVSAAIKEQNAILDTQGVKLGKIGEAFRKVSNAITGRLSLKKLGLQMETDPEKVKEVVNEASLQTMSPGKFSKFSNAVKEENIRLTKVLTEAETQLGVASKRLALAENEVVLAEQRLAKELSEENILAKEHAEINLVNAKARHDTVVQEIADINAKKAAMVGISETVAATEATIAASGSSMLVTIGGAFKSLLALAPELIAIFMLVNSVMDSVTPDTEVLDTKDYDKIIGENQELIESGQKLQDSRKYYKEQLNDISKGYGELIQRQKSLESISNRNAEQEQDLVETRKSLAVVSSNYEEAQNGIRSATEQLLDQFPELNKHLIDSKGRITDETGKFDENTKAIEENLNKRKLLAEFLNHQRTESAKTQIQESKSQISKNNNTSKMLSNPDDLVNIIFQRQYDRLVSKYGENDSRVQYVKAIKWLPDQSTILSPVVNALDAGANFLGLKSVHNALQTAKNAHLSMDDRKKMSDKLSTDNVNLNKTINEAKKALTVEQSAINNGFLMKKGGLYQQYVYNKDGKIKVDNEGNYIVQSVTQKAHPELYVPGYDFSKTKIKGLVADTTAYNQSIQNATKVKRGDIQDVEGTTSEISRIFEDSDKASQAKGIQYEIQAQLALNKANGDETDKTYLKFMKLKNEAIINSLNDAKSDMAQVYQQFVDTRTILLKGKDANFVKLINSGLKVDEIIGYIDQIKRGVKLALDPNLTQTLTDFYNTVNGNGGYGSGVTQENRLNSTIGAPDISTIRNSEEVTKQFNDYKAQTELRIAQLQGELNKKKKDQKSLLQSINEIWDPKRQMAEIKKDKSLIDNQISGILEGTTAWKNDIIQHDKEIRTVLIGQISAINKVMKRLKGKDLLDAKLKVLELQRDVEKLNLEISGKDVDKDILTSITSRWDNKIKLLEATKDRDLGSLELKDIEQGSSVYDSKLKSFDLNILNLVRSQIRELRNSLSKMDSSKRQEALLTITELEKRGNELLKEIKDNTSKIGEFNKPSNVKALTYYDYLSKDAGTSKVQIDNANFSFKIDGVNTVQQFDKIMNDIAQYLKVRYNANITTRNNYK